MFEEFEVCLSVLYKKKWMVVGGTHGTVVAKYFVLKMCIEITK